MTTYNTFVYQRGFAPVAALIIVIVAALGGAYAYNSVQTENRIADDTSTTTSQEEAADTTTFSSLLEKVTQQKAEDLTESITGSMIVVDTNLTFTLGEYKRVTFSPKNVEGKVSWVYEPNPAPGLSFAPPPAPGYACITEPCPIPENLVPTELYLEGRATKVGTYEAELSMYYGTGKSTSRTLTITVVANSQKCPRSTDANGLPLSDSVTGKFRGLVGTRVSGAVVLETDGPAPLTSKTSYSITAEAYDELKGVSGGTTITIFSYVKNALSGANPPYSCVEIVE